MRDVHQYDVDVCTVQETKIENAGIHRVKGSMIITFDSKNKHYGNAFVVPKKWQEFNHKYWRASDRICVLQLSGNPDTCADGPQYKCKLTGNCRIKISKIKMKPKNIINIINVYAPTSDHARKYPNELKRLYKNLDKLCKGLDKAPSSITMLAWNFNGKVGRRTGPENCIRHWSRDKRNQNGTNLIEFCGKNGKIIANSCFQHLANYTTTWLQRRTNLVAKETVSIYNQIDYINLN